MLHVRSALPPSRGSETSQYWELIFIRHTNQGSPDASTQPPPCPDRRVVVTASSAECWRPIKKLVVYQKRRRDGERKSLVEASKEKNQSNQKNSLQESMTACWLVTKTTKNASDLRKYPRNTDAK
jgi:hypothetical protein